jgi:hypothetical protein
MLLELVPVEESRAMARRLIEPLWKVVVEKGDDATKFRTLEALVAADPAGTLEKIESAKFVVKWREARIQAAIAGALAASDPEEAAAVAEAIADPGPRAGALIADFRGRVRNQPFYVCPGQRKANTSLRPSNQGTAIGSRSRAAS